MIILTFALFALSALAAYFLWIRPWHLRWGANDEDVARGMLGDDIVKRPTFDATRAVTINARPEQIWPWLVQVGCKRAGWYSYDWIDNLGVPSAERIIPGLQSLKVGDTIPMSPDGTQGLTVRVVEVNRSMLWTSGDQNATWAWNLYKLDERRTRLVARVRMRYNWKPPWTVFNLLFDPGDFIMMRKMLLGIKRRVENYAGLTDAPATPLRACRLAYHVGTQAAGRESRH
jgi:hypothetical protein